MNIAILGTGCPNCKKLERNAQKAIEQAGKDATIEKVTDIEEIMSYGITAAPAIAIDGDVKAQGKVSTVDEIRHMLG